MGEGRLHLKEHGGKEFVFVEFDESRPGKPVYLGKAENREDPRRPQFFAVFAKQNSIDAELEVIPLSDLVSGSGDYAVSPVLMGRVSGQIVDPDVRPDFIHVGTGGSQRLYVGKRKVSETTTEEARSGRNTPAKPKWMTEFGMIHAAKDQWVKFIPGREKDGMVAPRLGKLSVHEMA